MCMYVYTAHTIIYLYTTRSYVCICIHVITIKCMYVSVMYVCLLQSGNCIFIVHSFSGSKVLYEGMLLWNCECVIEYIV